jgi:hypothetical protein
MREADFRDAETLLIRLNHLARPNREAALILERVKLYLADQFDRGDHPYVLPAEFAAAGKTTCRFFPREGDTLPKHQQIGSGEPAGGCVVRKHFDAE